jgi:hypothetical protein
MSHASLLLFVLAFACSLGVIIWHVERSASVRVLSRQVARTLRPTAAPASAIHRFWVPRGDSLNRKVGAALRSVLRTQERARQIVWTLPETARLLREQTRDMRCPSSDSTLEVRSIEELAVLAEKGGLPQCSGALRATQGAVALSDLIRFMALFFFGGVYADMDVIFLRDMGYFQGLAFAYKWDRDVQYYNTAVMGLPRGSALVPQLIAHFGECTPRAFYPSTIHEALDCSSLVCEGLLMMPTALFSPVSAPMSNWQWQRDDLNRIGFTTDWFFDAKRLWSLDHFFPGAYTFHWHNRWEHAVHTESWFADLERLHNEGCMLPPRGCRRVWVDLGADESLYGRKGADEVYVFEIDPAKVASILDMLRGDTRLAAITQVGGFFFLFALLSVQ